MGSLDEALLCVFRETGGVESVLSGSPGHATEAVVMGLFGGLRKARTETVARVLLEIEFFAGAQLAAVVNMMGVRSGRISIRRARQTEVCSEATARTNLDQAMVLARRDSTTGLRKWPMIDLDANASAMLQVLQGVLGKAVAFRGSSKGLTRVGVALVQEHFDVLDGVRKDVTSRCAIQAGSGESEEESTQQVLADACDRIEGALLTFEWVSRVDRNAVFGL